MGRPPGSILPSWDLLLSLASSQDGCCGLPCTVPGPLLPGECAPGLAGPRGGTATPGPFLVLSYSPLPRRDAHQVPGVLGSLGFCVKNRSSWGDTAEKQATLSALSSLPGVSAPQELCCPPCHSLGPAESCCMLPGKHLGTYCLVGSPVLGTRAPEWTGTHLHLAVSLQSAGTSLGGGRA